MDKQEYKILLEEIMKLTEEERFVEAADIADRINWRKVPSFTVLQKISNLYKINRRYEEALEIILMAYDRNPKSRSILYSLCELCIENNDIGSALKYLSEYRKIAPREPDAYILQYEILEQQEAPLEDRIELLEELNRKYYREEWAYQLAYLYHRVGLATKCVETCDQLITWFGDGPFVIKAMELKMLHAKLTAKQQAVYDHRNDYAQELEAYEGEDYVEEDEKTGTLPEMAEEDFHVKTIDMSKFNTINLQKELAKNMREIMGDDYDRKPNSVTSQLIQPLMDDQDSGIMNTSGALASEDDILSKYDTTRKITVPDKARRKNAEENEMPPEEYSENTAGNEEIYNPDEIDENGNVIYPEDAPEYEDEIVLQDGEEILYEGEDGRLYYANGEVCEEELYYEDGTVFQTGQIPPGEELPEEELPEEKPAEPVNPDSIQAALQQTAAAQKQPDDAQIQEQALPENPEEIGMDFSKPQSRSEMQSGPDSKTGEIFFEDKTGDIVMDKVPVEVLSDVIAMAPDKVKPSSANSIDIHDVELSQKPIVNKKTNNFEDVLSLEQDGQISLVMNEKEMMEKQITGQMNIEEMLANWENIRQYHEDQKRASRHKNIVDRTGPLFDAFDESTKNDLLARLEDEHRASRRVIKNDLELKKVEEVEDNIEGGDAKLEHVSIWDEVDAAVEADRKAAQEAAVAAGAGIAAGADIATDIAAEAGGAVMEAAAGGAAAVAAGAIQAGELLGDAAEFVEDMLPEDIETEDDLADDAVYEEDLVADDRIPDAEYVEEDGTFEEAEEEDAMPLEEEPEDVDDAVLAEEEIGPQEDEAAAYEGPDLNTSEINTIGDALEAAADQVEIETADEINDEYSGEEEERDFSPEEKELFTDFLYSKKMRRQILDAVDMVGLAAYVGNVIITGDPGTGVLDMAKNMIKDIQLTDSNFIASKVAKISGAKMNRKDIGSMFGQLANGALIIEKASDMNKDTLESITKVLETTQDGILIVMTDTKKAMDNLISGYEVITGYFNVRIDITPMSNNALVAYAKKYALAKEYRIDEEKAVLALHQRISELQIGDHNVSPKEIEDIVDAAIEHARKPGLGIYFSILGGKRYDYNDMIILKEKDFMR